MELLILIVFLFLITAIILIASHGIGTIEAPERRVGRQGEERASEIIKSILWDTDKYFANVEIEFDQRKTELDHVIVNKFGVFIIETKNYYGVLEGTEEDFEWRKYHVSGGGNIYEKSVKNPIRQVKRQVYLLAHYLNYYGVNIWVEGYAFLLHGNSPVESKYILGNARDMDKAIHKRGKTQLEPQLIEAITNLLS